MKSSRWTTNSDKRLLRVRGHPFREVRLRGRPVADTPGSAANSTSRTSVKRIRGGSRFLPVVQETARAARWMGQDSRKVPQRALPTSHGQSSRDRELETETGTERMQSIIEMALFSWIGRSTEQFSFALQDQRLSFFDPLANLAAIGFEQGSHIGDMPRLRTEDHSRRHGALLYAATKLNPGRI